MRCKNTVCRHGQMGHNVNTLPQGWDKEEAIEKFKA